MELMNLSCEGFLEELASKAAAPGGGGASALVGAAGVALGRAAEAAELSDGHMVRNVVLFSVLVYELGGPTLAKLSLTAAGEIIPEGRTSARTTNKPEEPVSVD